MALDPSLAHSLHALGEASGQAIGLAIATDALTMVKQVSDQVGGLTRQMEHLAQTIDSVGDRVSDIVPRIDSIGRDVIEVRHEIHDDRRRINSLFGMVTAPKSNLDKTKKIKKEE